MMIDDFVPPRQPAALCEYPAVTDHIGGPLDSAVEERTPGWVTASVAWSDVSRPDSIPSTDSETNVALAEQILEMALSDSRFGHHRSLSESVTDFANAHRHDDDTPDYWRRRAYQLGPDELNFGRIEHTGETPDEQDQSEAAQETALTQQQREKAKTVLAWAGDTFDRSELRSLANDLAVEYAMAWVNAKARLEQQHSAADFLLTLPDEYGDWQRVPSPENAIAYAGPPTTQGGDVEMDSDADGDILLLFDDGEYHRCFKLPFDTYATVNPAITDEVLTDEARSARRGRLATPESWLDGAASLLDHMADTAWPEHSSSVLPNATESPKVWVAGEDPTTAIVRAQTVPTIDTKEYQSTVETTPDQADLAAFGN